jgi:zinc protease
VTRHILTVMVLSVWLAGCAAHGALQVSSSGEEGLPPPTRQVLDNGLRLIIQDHRAANIVALYLFVGVGGRDEAPNQLGFSHFQEHMLFKGTDTQPPGWVDRAVEGAGGKSDAKTSLDYTYYSILAPVEETADGIKILAEMAFRSKFDPVELKREGEVIVEEGNIEQDTPRTALIRGLYGLVFRDNPYGRSILGSPETLGAATRETVFAYYKRHYVPEAMTLVVVGPVSQRAVTATVREVFGKIPATGYRRAPVPPPAPLTGGIRHQVERPEQQAFLGMAWVAPRAENPDGFAVDLLASILGGSESSRLARTLRDRDQLVSSITMSYAALQGAGIISLRAELEAPDLEKVERLILEEIARIQADGVTEDERQLAVIQFESTRRPPRGWRTPTASPRRRGAWRPSSPTWTASSR